jgi:lipopolysaccharide/colanic/teichoic acid biosynthesis glycosyltransferase
MRHQHPFAGIAPEYRASPWSISRRKRLLDLIGAILLLIPAAPVMGLLALAVRLSSPGPALFRQRRPGRDGMEFDILKYRTMVENATASGPAMTLAADPRITPLGGFMRRWKLDELPQLFNVLRGEMSLVGPRPLPLAHWQLFCGRSDARSTLSVRPGITGAATLQFLNEEKLLASLPVERLSEIYRDGIMPMKFSVDGEYMARATFASDLRLLLTTALSIFRQASRVPNVQIHQNLLERGTVTLPREPEATFRDINRRQDVPGAGATSGTR